MRRTTRCRRWPVIRRLRPNVLLVAGMLALVCCVDILDNGTATVGLAAVGGLCAIVKDIIRADDESE